MATAIFVLFFVALALAVVLSAMRAGRRGPLFDPNARGSRRAVAWLTVLAVAVFGIGIPIVVGIDAGDEAKAGPIALTGSQQKGRELFAKACQQCHTLKAVHATGRVGPNLDVLRPPKTLVEDAILKGRARGQGQMPSQLYTGRDAKDVADFVAAVAGRAE